MSSSSPRRLRTILALLAALAAAGLTAWTGVAQAAGAQLEVVAVLPSPAGGQVTLVANVRPPPADRIPADGFSVTTGDGQELPTRAQPLMFGSPSVGLVVDPPAPGASDSPGGASGAANLLLQLPLGTRIVLVADTTPPKVLAPLRTGAATALQALSAAPPGGATDIRDTPDALNLVIGQLPPADDGLRIVVLHTDAPDAGGVPAAELGLRLRDAHVVLAVVTTSSSTAYWSQVAAATGGLVGTARPAAPMAAFDDVAEELRSRYVVTFARPGELPARVSVRVNTPGGTSAADAAVPAASRAPAAKGASRQPGGADRAGNIDSIWLAVAGVAVLAMSALLILRRWRASTRSQDRERAAGTGASRPQSEAPAELRIVGPSAVLPEATGSGPTGHPVSATADALARQRASGAQAAARAVAGRAAGEAAAGSGPAARPITADDVNVARQRARAGEAAARAVGGREAGEAAAAAEAQSAQE
jgi:hypothetical protein